MRAHPMRSLPLLLLSFGLALGCGSGVEPSPGTNPEPDAGAQMDGATDAGSRPDAGPGPDAGTRPDAGPGDAGAESDAGLPPDAGPGTDAGEPLDAGPDADAGSGVDAGTGTDAGTDAGTVVDAGSSPCGVPYLGDPSLSPSYTPTAVGPDYTSAPVGPGGTVSVIEPFQGGRVSFLGVRNVLNMDPCGVSIIGAVRDLKSGRLQRDSRTFNLKRSADGKGSSDDADTETFSNVTLCPNNWSDQDLYGTDKDYELTFILKDRNGKALQQVFSVKLACNVPGQESYCMCICKKGYVLGTPCP